MMMTMMMKIHASIHLKSCFYNTTLSFESFFHSISLAESPPRDLQITVFKIMGWSCVVPSKCVLLQILFCSCVIETTLWCGKWQIASLSCQTNLNMKKNLANNWSNSVIEKYRDLSVARQRLRQTIDLRITNKLRYFAQPHSRPQCYLTSSSLRFADHVTKSRKKWRLCLHLNRP